MNVECSQEQAAAAAAPKDFGDGSDDVIAARKLAAAVAKSREVHFLRFISFELFQIIMFSEQMHFHFQMLFGI